MIMKALSKVCNYFLLCYVSAQIKFWEVRDQVRGVDDSKLIDEVVDSYKTEKG